MTKVRILSANPEQTREIARNLAKEIPVSGSAPPLTLALCGDLGSGKTTFVQGLARELGIKEPVTSPSFVLVRRYPLKKGGNFYHIDCYRLTKTRDLLELGFREIIASPGSIIAIEWADKIQEILPRKYLKIQFSHQAPKERLIKLSITKKK